MVIQNKSQQVEAYLRRAIKQGDWTPGGRITPERELLSRLKVGRSTLREALATLARDGLVERKQGAGTFVCSDVHQGAIGIIANVAHLASPLGYQCKQLIDSVQVRAQTGGYDTRLIVGRAGDSGAGHLSRHTIANTAGALSTMWISSWDREELSQANIPLVSVGAGVPLSEFGTVYDYSRLVQMAVKLLSEHGHDDFAVMYALEDDFHSGDHCKRFNSMMARLCLEAVGGDAARVVGIPVTPSYDRAYEVFKDFWKKPNRPRAILFMDDGVCDVATRGILEMGIRVPDDLAVVTQSVVGREFQFPVAITCVEFDPGEAAAAACDILDNLISQEPVHEKMVYVAPRIRPGDSL